MEQPGQRKPWISRDLWDQPSDESKLVLAGKGSNARPISSTTHKAFLHEMENPGIQKLVDNDPSPDAFQETTTDDSTPLTDDSDSATDLIAHIPQHKLLPHHDPRCILAASHVAQPPIGGIQKPPPSVIVNGIYTSEQCSCLKL